jgi:2-oxoglutarate ferredoxin oxidoreductase subunit alpha
LTIFNSDKVKSDKGIAIPADTITKEAEGLPIMSNTALIGGMAKIMGIDWEILEEVLRKEIEKGIEKNLEIGKKAYDKATSVLKVEKLKNNPKPLLTGNEALSLGAVKTGLQMYYAYPMTPATGILHYLAENKKDLNVVVSQLENEIAVAIAASGSAYAGKRTMVGTSGGGFALMTETISLDAQAEIPLVFINSQRSGPSTGVPTYSGQTDLLFSLYGGHGDFLRFVVAPGDAEESCYWSGKLMNLSWKYQTPSILLIDKEVSESTFSFKENVLDKIKKEEALLWDKKGEYKRYLNSFNGISPLAFPGDNAVVKATSYEHDEYGLSVEDGESIVMMQEKRMRKFREMEKEIDNLEAVKTYGNLKSDKAVICWGSVKGAVKEAAEELGLKVIQPIVIQPFPVKQFKEALKGVNSLILVEAGAWGQMGSVLKRHGVKFDGKILKYDMRPFTPDELTLKIKEIWKN